VTDVVGQQLPAMRGLPPSGNATVSDIVTVLIGSNDLLGRRNRADLPSQFGVLIRQLPHGSIVSTLPQPRRAASAVNSALETARATGALRVLDMRRNGPRSWRGRLAADHFHPNEAGYQAIAEAFLPFVLDA
jgi:lysophospholipase L1-like esterase